LVDKEKKNRTTKRIKDIILKSGYLLEIDVADYLRQDGWLVFSQHPYSDKKENKPNFIDILAMKTIKKDLGVSLLIECKKSTKHGWAFSSIGKKRQIQSLLALLGDLVAKLEERIETMNKHPIIPMDGDDFFKGFHPTLIETRIGTSCCIPPKHPDDFHKAQLQLLSAMRSLKKTFTKQIIFPAIIFDGAMWEFYKKEGDLEVKETEYLQYLTAVFDEKYEHPCLIDVVKFSFLPRYLELVNGSIEWLKKASITQRD